MQAFGLQNPSPHGAEWQKKAIEQAKQRFADLLFPALMKDDPQPFEELLAAMAHCRRTTVSLDEFVRHQQQASKMKPSKKEMGRRLRLALLNLSPDDLTSMRGVLSFLARFKTEYSDESHVHRVMRELDIRLLKQGDTVYFRFSEADPATGDPKKWFCPRKIVVGLNGAITNFGMSQKDYEGLLGWKAHRVQPATPDK